MDSIKDHVDVVRLWLDMWADSQSDITSPDPSDEEERRVIRSGFVVVRELEKIIEERKNLLAEISRLRKKIGPTEMIESDYV